MDIIYFLIISANQIFQFEENHNIFLSGQRGLACNSSTEGSSQIWINTSRLQTVVSAPPEVCRNTFIFQYTNFYKRASVISNGNVISSMNVYRLDSK
jgi:hypothetical protein